LKAHEYHEDVERVLKLKQSAFNADVSAIALDNAHSVAFHSGLGAPIYPTPASPYQKYLNEEYIASFADVVYSKPNIALVAEGADSETLSRWVGQFFKDVPATSRSGQTLETTASKYYGGEQRASHPGGNSMVIAFPGTEYGTAKPEIAVLAALLGGKPTIKWAPGFSLLSKSTGEIPGLSISASNLNYSDAGLLAVQLSGPAASVRSGAQATVKALESIANGSVAKEDITKAIANAKFNALDDGQLREPSLHLAGAGIVTTGKPYDFASLAQAIDSVTAEKLKAVSALPILAISGKIPPNTNVIFRLPRLFLMEKRPFPLSATSLSCRTLRSLVSGFRWRANGRNSLYQQSQSSRSGSFLAPSFVNTCSRYLFCPYLLSVAISMCLTRLSLYLRCASCW
jgi:ubiquinol-cytochrome c reductase core subunit 2